MTAPPPSPNPLGPDAPKEDYVPLAIAAIGFGIAVGTAAIAVVTWLVRTLQIHTPVTDPPTLGLPGTVLLAGTLLGLLASATSVWATLAPVRSPYRQGGLAMATTFATFLVSAIGTFVADNYFGRGGLLGLALLGVLLAWRLGLKVSRAREALA